MSDGRVIRQKQGPTSYVEPVHHCEYPSVNDTYRYEIFAPGSAWECECGKQWIVMKVHSLDGNWRALWRTSNPARRLIAGRY